MSTQSTHEHSPFGAALRRCRLAAGLSQERLAERAGLSARTLSDLERGVAAHPRLETVQLLARALGLPEAERLALLAAARPTAAPDAPDVPDTTPRRPPERLYRLPRPLTPFIGREAEVDVVRQRLIEAATCLLTLTGPGGTGKTRLALAVAASVLAEYPDGVVFVPLATLTDHSLVLATIAQTLGIVAAVGPPLNRALSAALRGRRILLLLDNLEHVLPAAPALAEVLASCPELTLLVTSRTPLHVQGERIVEVPPLRVPTTAAGPPLEALTQYDAVRLFVERARDVQPDFAISDENASAVAEICARLDGLPLAIELAAARIRLLPPPALLARLDSRLGLLTGGSRDRPARHQTLRGTIDWSYNLLAAAEQTLFARLGVFVGGCTLDTAEAVCAAVGELPVEVIDGLDSLLDKSLLRRVEGGAGPLRVEMLETLREYALERLAASGEEDALRAAHADHYRRLAEAAEPEVMGPRQEAWLERLEREHANLRAALGWAAAHGSTAQGLALAGALWRFWRVRGHHGEGRAWLERFLGEASGEGPSATPPEVRARALLGAAWLAHSQCDYARAETLLEESMTLYRGLGQQVDVAAALVNRGMTAFLQGDLERAAAALEESVALYRATGNRESIGREGLGLSLYRLSMVRRTQGAYVQARTLGEECLALHRAQDDQHGVAVALLALGDIARDQGDTASVQAYCGESLALFAALGDMWGQGFCLHNLGLEASQQGDLERAVALCVESVGHFRALGNDPSLAEVLISLGIVERTRGTGERARAALAEGLTLAWRVGPRWLVASALARLAVLAAAQGQAERAAQLWGASAALHAALGVPPTAAEQAASEQAGAAVRAALGAAAFAAAWAAGERLSPEQTIDACLQDDGEGVQTEDAAARRLPSATSVPAPAQSTPDRPALRAATAAPASAAPSPLVGRERELGVLAEMLAGAGDLGARLDPPLLLLAGEPGIGKTRLLQAAAQRAIEEGWCVLAGGCRRGGQEPYAPLLDALARHLQVQTPERRRVVLAGCAWLVPLLPELADALEPLPPGVAPPAQERRLTFAAVARLLVNVAGPAGTALLLDDLQWAGPDALDLLAALLRGRPAAPLRVVGAYRDTEVGPDDPLAHRRADLAQAGLVRHHALGPLAPAAAAELLADLLGTPAGGGGGDALAARVLERAGGMPFYLVSYAQALRDGGGGDAAPWDVAQGVRQRVALLSEAARQLLGVAAVVGRHVPWALLVAVTGLPEEAVLAGLEAVGRARLLVEDGEAGYAFTHDVIREVMEADLGMARRAVLHRRVAEALEVDPAGAPPEVLAYHYTCGGNGDRAMTYLERAGDAAWGQRAHGAAEGHYRALMERLERLGRAHEALRVREKLAEILYLSGDYETTLAVLAPAAEACRADGDLEGLGRVAAKMGWAHARRATPREGLALIEPLRDLMEQGSSTPSSLAPLCAALAQLHFATGRYAASLAASERASGLARAGGDDRVHALAEGHRMFLLYLLGRLGEALQVGQRLLPLVERVGDLDSLLRAHRDLAQLYATRGAIATSRGHIARAGALAAQMGDPAQRAHTLAKRGWIDLLGGDWLAARDALDEAVALIRQVDHTWYAPYPLIYRARLALAVGEEVAASAGLAAALALAERTGDLQARRWASTDRAELDILEGRPKTAVERLEPLLDRPGLQEGDVTKLLPVLAWAYVEQGQVERATQTLHQALVRARREEMRLVLVEALRVQALIALRREHGALAANLAGQGGSPRPLAVDAVPSLGEEAARALEEGLSLARAMPHPYAEARLLYIDGLRQVQAGQPQAAQGHLEAAHAIFYRLGARRDAVQVDQALASLSHHATKP